MELTIGPRGYLQIDNTRIVYRNFSGAASKFNREGDRNFSVVIEGAEMAQALADEGWNVKVKPPREDGDDPFITLPIKIGRFNERGPNVYLKTGSKVNRLDEESIGILDQIEIANVDLDIRPYDWEVNGKTGRSAYLQAIHVTQGFVDRFAERFENDRELPFD